MHDLTRPIAATTAAFPGDTPTAVTPVLRMAGGAAINLSTLTCSLHAATHLDAPWHYDDDGQRIDALDPAALVGPCVIVDARGHDPIPASLIPRGVERVLIRTGGWPDDATFPTDFPVLSAEAAAKLKGAVLVGVDVPSVDKPDSKTLPVHHALREAGVLILEGLTFERLPAGVTGGELIALPLRITGGDASPVRAVLRETR